jgi:outer membrane protein assembly factor BamB
MLKKLLFLLCSIICMQHGIFSQDSSSISIAPLHNVKVAIGTFLGNWQRNYYGNEAPSKLNILWKTYLGKGVTIISKRIGEKEWEGCGWTGQPLLLDENNKLYLIQGAFDHNLKKINAANGEVVWQYKFDDVIKGTGTIWINRKAKSIKESAVILQGSRRGVGKYCDSDFVPSFRGISYFSGEELWRLDVKRTRSYSRDVDGSALVLNDTAYIGLENAIFTVFNPDCQAAAMKDNMLQPGIYQELKLFNNNDVIKRGGKENTFVNLVVESSPCLLNDHIYITTGSGHVFGYNIKSKQIDWDFYIGSDMDGSPIVTSDSCILVTV